MDFTSLKRIEDALSSLPKARAGTRLHGIAELRPFLEADGEVGTIAAAKLGAGCKPVRAVLFDKTATTNWSVGWHQDRTIAVAHRHDMAGFGPWTIKDGMPHVEPPFALLARMVTLRLHLDPVSASNAPLRIAPGSQKLGRIGTEDVHSAVRNCGSFNCLADAGDVWIYATPLLHTSDAARVPSRRRVLQVDYSPDELPGRLAWLGV